MKPRHHVIYITLLYFLVQFAFADEPLDSQHPDRHTIWLPFVYNSKVMDYGVGITGVTHGFGQPQATLLGVGMATINHSWLTYIKAKNYLIPTTRRLFFGGSIFRDHYTNPEFYISGNPAFPPGEAGTNDSSEDDFVTGLANEETLKLYLQYFFPVWAGKDNLTSELRIRSSQTFRPPPDACCLPLLSLTGTLFSQFRKVIPETSSNIDDTAGGLELALSMDYRNSFALPSRGGQSTVTLTGDAGTKGNQPWLTWQFSQSYFFKLPANQKMLQQVLALNFYLADTPTWNDFSGSESDRQYHRPTAMSGNTLGGYNRLRGYYNKRYFGRSAINYVAEYRVLPSWQPLHRWPVFNLFDIPWWQWVGYAELGRVADKSSWSTLNSDLKWDIGAGVRMSVERVILRASYATGEEGGQFWIMVGQPF